MSIVTVEKARSRLGLAATANHRDEEIQDLLNAAEGHVEDLSGHILERRQVTVPLVPVDGEAAIFAWPIATVDALSYRNGNGVQVDQADPGLVIADGFQPWRIQVGVAPWPGDYSGSGRVTVTAGYADLADVPPKLVQAVLLLVGQWFEDPTGERPISPQVKSLCFGFRNVS
jgi:uncharacterized phiE125 gp8 family phage protein